MEAWLESFARANFLRSGDTAHDLKTPLNVAVLNLELLRMRVRKVAGDSDEKLESYARSIEIELRRMARIFDTFFLLSVPPRNEGEPVAIDLCALCAAAAGAAGFDMATGPPASVRMHETRIRQALQFLFEGAERMFKPAEREASVVVNGAFTLNVTGVPHTADLELSKVFKFYYTNQDGNADLSLAAARLIAETYGGDLSASQDRDKVTLRMSFPLGDK
jgi:nitrogen fixation/metabolism regulation signal transduction histidine kinase